MPENKQFNEIIKGADVLCKRCGTAQFVSAKEKQFEIFTCAKCYTVNHVKWVLVGMDAMSDRVPRGIKPVRSDKHDSGTYLCPSCDAYVGSSYCNNSGCSPAGKYLYCPKCGQRIDWIDWKNATRR